MQLVEAGPNAKRVEDELVGLRIKGQDVVVDVIKNGAVVNSVVNVRNFEMELLMETI